MSLLVLIAVVFGWGSAHSNFEDSQCNSWERAKGSCRSFDLPLDPRTDAPAQSRRFGFDFNTMRPSDEPR